MWPRLIYLEPMHSLCTEESEEEEEEVPKSKAIAALDEEK